MRTKQSVGLRDCSAQTGNALIPMDWIHLRPLLPQEAPYRIQGRSMPPCVRDGFELLKGFCHFSRHF